MINMEEVTILKTRFKYSGQYSLSSYYNLMYDIFRSMGYGVEETNYIRKLNPDGSQKEIELVWDCLGTIDGYSKIKINAKTLIVGIGTQQTQIDGKPVTRDVGTLELEMKSSILIDYENRWESNPIMRHLKGFYDKYFYKPVFDNLIAKTAGNHYKVENEMKAFFNMQTFL